MDRKILLDEYVRHGNGQWPVMHVRVKETGWENAVDTMAVYLAMGKDDAGWTYMNKDTLGRIIETLQRAHDLAEDPKPMGIK